MSSLPRSAAYRAVLSSLQGKTFASQILEDWGRQAKPSTTDERFAREITYGAIRMARCLDFLAEKAAEKNKLRLGNREKALLRTAAYQLVFMDRTAAYAAVNESVQLAKTLGNPSFPGFLNAILRKLSTVKESLPKGNSVQDLGIRYSYPDVYVEQLLRIYPLQDVVEILEAGNRPSLTYARKRPSFEMEPVTDLNKTANSPEFYIQNPTPAALMVELCSKIMPPNKVLDLCSAPGGKLLAVHDLFPKAKLFANELSLERSRKLYENIEKYGLEAQVRIGPGEEYPLNDQFDLIIIDTPCSNSGVLNKRPEARWRINPESIEALNATQHSLIHHAAQLVSAKGAILYLTCSILPQENEELIRQICKDIPLKVTTQKTILPDKQGKDGGFGVVLTRTQ